jgi:hypothetical protein
MIIRFILFPKEAVSSEISLFFCQLYSRGMVLKNRKNSWNTEKITFRNMKIDLY